MQDAVTRCLGLVTQYNPLTVAPGALIQADNAVIRRENTLENRRGYAVYGTLPATASKLMAYLKRVLALNSTSVHYDNGSGTFAAYSGTYSAPSSARMRSVEARGNLYATTTKGVQVFTNLTGTAARYAGAPRCLDPSGATAGAGSGFLSASSQCAYRCVIQRTDSNGNVLVGYPSTRLVVYNTGGTSDNVALTLTLHSECVAGDVIQFYRTEQVAGTASDAAGDEMGLVYQFSLSASDISTGTVTFTDSIIDALRGATLYTSSSQEGIAQANERPPQCRDIALYKNDYLFYANTQTRQRLNLTLVGTGSLSGHSIKVNGVTFSFGATENTATGQVKVSAAVLASVKIDETARSLVRVINRYASNTTVYAYYLSGPDDLPGQILIEERGVGAAAFTVQSGDSTIAPMFYPAPPVTPLTSTESTSTNSVQKNAIYYSKAQEPEHVPLLNYLLVGSSNNDILRIAPLRDSVIVIKDNEGVYRLTGESEGNFTVSPLDLTVICKSADSVVVLNNQVFMLSNQGVVAISDTGVQVVSREIEDAIGPLLGLSNLDDYTVGCAYESERSYLLSTISASTDTEPTQTFVFNFFTKTWTRWTFGFTDALVEDSTDKLFFIKSGDSNVYRERKDFSDSDYADPEYSITITGLSGKDITFTTLGITPEAGWVIETAGSGITIDSVVDNGGGSYTATLVITPPSDWVPGSGELFPSVAMEIVWDTWSGSQPGMMKQVREFKVLTDNLTGNNSLTALTATFRTDLDGDQEEIEIENAASRFGTSPFGEFPWGGVGDNSAAVTWPPANKQYCRLMNAGVKHSRAREKISISGCVYTFNMIGERTNK